MLAGVDNDIQGTPPTHPQTPSSHTYMLNTQTHTRMILHSSEVLCMCEVVLKPEVDGLLFYDASRITYL